MTLQKQDLAVVSISQKTTLNSCQLCCCVCLVYNVNHEGVCVVCV